MTGDGGWAHADEETARELVNRGAAVVGLNMRSYLSRTKTPDIVAQDVRCLAEAYMARWSRPYLMLLGYSRGADLAPFVASRIPDSLRTHLTAVTLVSASQWAGFTFHLIDLVRDVHRDDDLSVTSELEKLRDIRVVCIYGRDDKGAICPQLDGTKVEIIALDGGHRITGGFAAMADKIVDGLRPRPARPPDDKRTFAPR